MQTTLNDPERLHECLQERLETVFRSVAHKRRVVVAYRASGRSTWAGIASEPEPHTDPADWTFPTGCLTKLFTGALMRRALAEGHVRLEDPASKLLQGAAGPDSLGEATIGDLLDHTHGIDDSVVRHAPLGENGFIDVPRLLAALAPHRLAPPGEIYSYSNAGAWLMAALLERLYGEPFARQLRTRLLEPLGVSIRVHSPSLLPLVPNGICASRGATLAVSAADMLAYLESEALNCPDAWPPTIPDAEIRPLPGWNALERGIFHGWKHHGEYWFGHNSIAAQASAMVRVQPHRGVAVVVASTYHPAPVVAAKLFADLLPEYQSLSFPKPLPAEAASQLDLASHCGRYRCAAEVLAVEAAGVGELHFTAPGVDTALIPAAGDTFFARPARRERFSFVQFLQRDGDGFRYLWDGRCVYRRCE